MLRLGLLELFWIAVVIMEKGLILDTLLCLPEGRGNASEPLWRQTAPCQMAVTREGHFSINTWFTFHFSSLWLLSSQYCIIVGAVVQKYTILIENLRYSKANSFENNCHLKVFYPQFPKGRRMPCHGGRATQGEEDLWARAFVLGLLQEAMVKLE